MVLDLNKSRLMKCVTKADVLLVIKTFGQFNMYIDNFIKSVEQSFQELFQDTLSKLSVLSLEGSISTQSTQFDSRMTVAGSVEAFTTLFERS